MERLVGDRGNELVRGARMALGAGLLLVLAGDRRCGVLGADDVMRTVAADAGRSSAVADLQFSAVEALLIALHDLLAESVLLGHHLLFMAFAAALDHVEMVHRGFFARLRLDIMGRSVAAGADRAVGRFLVDDVLPVHARLVCLVDVGMALCACCLGNRVDLALG